ncbi:ArnT family glycosyltransferase [Pseudomonadota bacterium]
MSDPTTTNKAALNDVWLATLIWCAITAAAIILRPLLPIDETRYITVAWEMWASGDFMVPTLNGEIYHHKPPFFFWLMDLGWAVGGVSETWARMVAPLFGLGSLILTARMAYHLWPDAAQHILKSRAIMAPLMLLCGVYWAVFSTMTMFDMLVTFGAMISLIGTLKAWKGFATGQGFWTGMLIMGLGMGIGGLAKGPAVLVHTLPVALLAPLWGPKMAYDRGEGSWKKWYAGVFAGLFFGVAVVLTWAVPAALIGGEEYRDAIFIKQSADRITKSFAHRRPAWWFLQLMPLVLLPWTLWPRLWKGVGARQAWREKRGLRAAWNDGGVRFLLIWSGLAFAIFSMFSGKQLHYLLPMYPALALFAAYLLTSSDGDYVHAKGRGHRVPAFVLAGLAAILLIAGLALPYAGDMVRNIPVWAGEIEPLWMAAPLVIAVLVAYMRAEGPRAEVRMIALTLASTIVFLHLTLAPGLTTAYDLEPAAKQVKTWQDEGRPVAYVGKYHGEFQFLGRLTQPLETVQSIAEGQAWAKANPTGVVIATMRQRDIPAEPKPLRTQPYRGKFLLMWDAKDF